MAYSVKRTHKFKRQYRKLIKSNPGLLNDLDAVIIILIKGKKLPDKNRNHKLSGNFADYWECHITPDWLLIYSYHHDELILELIATGSHSELF